ncbi:MAG: nucleoside deaminase [Chitinispirillaceae bacterium]|nr:nucleoside deaminase [Chitinispirillaceae bacterium]
MNLFSTSHERFMQAAIQEALKAFDEGEVPIGAVIVKNGTIIGRGFNRTESIPDASAHAEIIAISAASACLSSWRLNECTIYVTAEPCLMCLGALMNARVASIVYGAPEKKTGAIDTHFYQQEIERTYGYFPQIISGICEHECSNLLTSFFQLLRKKN